jgi:hypothetical protein
MWEKVEGRAKWRYRSSGKGESRREGWEKVGAWERRKYKGRGGRMKDGGELRKYEGGQGGGMGAVALKIYRKKVDCNSRHMVP